MSLFRLMLLALALVSTSALRVPAATTRVASRPAAAHMAMPNLDDARNLSTDEIEQEIAAAKKELFELRKKVKTRQQVKPHLFTHTKHHWPAADAALAAG